VSEERNEASADSDSEAKAYALRCLARREFSQSELRQRLSRRGHNSKLIDSVLEWLIEASYQSDERFAESRIRHRSNQAYGPRRISQELKQQGIESALISRHFQEQACDWYELASLALEKKFGQSRVGDLREKARRHRYLNQRGFEADHIRFALSKQEDAQ